MARKPRIITPGHIYHVLNRASARLTIFHKPADYLAFEKILLQAQQKFPVPLLAYALMPNHFHLLLWPQTPAHAKRLSDFMRWLTVTHTQRHHAHYHTEGTGHLYQGRFKTFPVEGNFHFRTVARYIEQNPLKAKLVDRAELWPFCSLHHRLHPTPESQQLLAPWPEPPKISTAHWLEKVNTLLDPNTTAKIQNAITRGTPFGSPDYIAQTAKAQNLTHTLRPRGRPKKPSNPTSSAR
jgi:putative transposase